MISDLNGTLGSRQFLNAASERTCFASCASTFKSTGLFTCLKRTCLKRTSSTTAQLYDQPTADGELQRKHA